MLYWRRKTPKLAARREGVRRAQLPQTRRTARGVWQGWLAALLALALVGLGGVGRVSAQAPDPFTLDPGEAYQILEQLIERRPLDQGGVRFQVDGHVSLVGLRAPFVATVEQQGPRAVVSVEKAPAFVPREIETVLRDARTYLADFDFNFVGVELLEGEPQALFQGTLKEGASGAQKGSIWISLKTGSCGGSPSPTGGGASTPPWSTAWSWDTRWSATKRSGSPRGASPSPCATTASPGRTLLDPEACAPRQPSSPPRPDR